MKSYEEKMESKENRFRVLEDGARALREEIRDMEKLLKKVRSGKKWTDTKFAAFATRQQKEIKELKKQLDECLGNEDYETLFEDSGTSGENDNSPKITNPSHSPS